MNASLYLQRIGASHSISTSPTYELLHKLHHLHVTTLPFENITTFLDQNEPVTLDYIRKKVLQSNR